jgi:hypothetical protein
MSQGSSPSERLPRPTIRSYPTQYVWEWRLKDGTPVTIRPIRPEDEPLMVQFHTTLSERSVYLRYFCSLSLRTRVEHERLVRICFGSYDRGFALVADRTNPETGQHDVFRSGPVQRHQSRGSRGGRAGFRSMARTGPGNRTAGQCVARGPRGKVPETLRGNFAGQSSHAGHLQEGRIQAASDGRSIVGLGPAGTLV